MRVGPVVFIAVCTILVVLVVYAGTTASGSVRQRAARGTGPDPELERARAYNRRLERQLRRQTSRAERNERRLLISRQTFRRALGTSPIGSHRLEVAFQCIHRHEGAWTDPGLPYFGGLQLDLDFQRAYGRTFLRHFGPANNWPRSVQLAVAINGWLHRGFQPWPNTARKCGLR